MIAGVQGPNVPIDDVAALRRLLAGRKCMLLDFDGPVCSVFAGYPAPRVAREIRERLIDERLPLSQRGIETTDPMVLLAEAAALSREGQTRAEQLLGAAELICVESAEPTPGIRHLLEVSKDTGISITITSNNGDRAIKTFLASAGLMSLVEHVVGRDPGDASLMKPHPHLVQRALIESGSGPTNAFMVGDSVTDMQAAVIGGVVGVGQANKPHKLSVLAAAGASAVITDLAQLSAALTPETTGS